MAAAAGGDSDGDSEEMVLTPAQLIHSLEQVPWARATGLGRGTRGLLSAGRSGADAERRAVAVFLPSRWWGCVARVFLAFTDSLPSFRPG